MNLDPSAFVADPDLIQALDRRSTHIACETDRILFNQGDAPKGVYILNKGETFLTMKSQAGAMVMCVQAPTGSLLGLPGLIGNEPYTLSAIARKGAEVGFVSRDDFTRLMQTDPQLSLRVLQVLAAEVRSARQALLEL